MPRTPLGTAIRRAIERKRMTQAGVAKALGVSRSAVNSWVNGRSHPQNSLGALEELLGVRFDGGEPEPKVPSDALRAQILAELGPERGEAFIAEMERRLGPPFPPPPAAQADLPEQRHPALAHPPAG